MRKQCAVLVAAATITAFTAPTYVSEAASFRLIAHPSVPVTSLSRSEVTSAFLKRTEKWPNGMPIVPVDQAHDSRLRESFSRDILERSVPMIDAFWQKQVFSGRGTPPTTKGSDAEVVAFVRSVPGAIGYVSAGTDIGDLKEIRIE
jgi:ABC-type phosphate transport system substrate-binding protein